MKISLQINKKHINFTSLLNLSIKYVEIFVIFNEFLLILIGPHVSGCGLHVTYNVCIHHSGGFDCFDIVKSEIIP